jgi:hypothetical protein
VSVQSLVGGGVAGRLRPRLSRSGARTEARDSVAVGFPRSMRILEAGLALTAIATAILIGMGR